MTFRRLLKTLRATLTSGSLLSGKLVCWFICLLGVSGFVASGAIASPLSDRVASFPDWQTKPPIEASTGEVVYPDWFAGSWKLTSTLVETYSPLAPEVTTPGYEGNQQFLNQPITCQVRFVAQNALGRKRSPLPVLSLPTQSLVKAQIVSDRSFNGLSLAKAYLGDRVWKVWVDPRDATRLITKFRDNRKLFSTVLGQAVEAPDADHFLASELFQQFFQSPEKPVKNEVETTTLYTRESNTKITADQITAVYLTPPHPRAYLAGDRPVALYRYQLELTRK